MGEMLKHSRFELAIVFKDDFMLRIPYRVHGCGANGVHSAAAHAAGCGRECKAGGMSGGGGGDAVVDVKPTAAEENLFSSSIQRHRSIDAVSVVSGETGGVAGGSVVSGLSGGASGGLSGGGDLRFGLDTNPRRSQRSLDRNAPAVISIAGESKGTAVGGGADDRGIEMVARGRRNKRAPRASVLRLGEDEKPAVLNLEAMLYSGPVGFATANVSECGWIDVEFKVRVRQCKCEMSS